MGKKNIMFVTILVFVFRGLRFALLLLMVAPTLFGWLGGSSREEKLKAKAKVEEVGEMKLKAQVGDMGKGNVKVKAKVEEVGTSSKPKD
ncbi:hypothetical protein C0991_010708 [Blastosporella zonata]|nr:hypothetical protein C0991_010708 [Blastosporella zonata]